MYFNDQNPSSEADVIKKFCSLATTLCCNKTLCLDIASHMTSFSQSECFVPIRVATVLENMFLTSVPAGIT